MRFCCEISKLKLVFFLTLGFITPFFAWAQCPNNPALTPTAWAGAGVTANYSGGDYTVVGTGENEYGQDYETGYTDSITMVGDGQIQTEVTSITGYMNFDTSSGIFIRGGTNAGADGGLLWIGGSSSSQYQLAERINDQALTQIQSGSASLPYWLRLQNSGGILYPSISTNGSTWTSLPVLNLIGDSEFAAGSTLTYGLMVWSGSVSASQPTTAIFENVCVTSISPIPTYTPIQTITSTSTFTPSFTSTLTPVQTFTPTSTFTSSFTFSATNSPTITNTPTITPSPTNTLSPQPTETPTITATPPPGVKVWPNPFTPLLPTNTITHFFLPANHGAGQLLIADLKRKLVRSLDFGAVVDVQWDGKDNGGNVVPSGVYLYLLESSGTVQRGTITVMR